MNNGSQSHTAACVREKQPSLISVIIPVFNVAPYLREALDSVVQQTYPHLEILIVDDGSTDGSGEICDEYRSDVRAQVIHQENRGLSGARNAGLDRAAGKYIAFLDPDDAWHPDFILKLLENMENVDVAVCQYEVHRQKLDTKGQIQPAAKKGFYSRKEALRALAEGTINVSVWNKLYRKELWKEIRFPEGHNYEDIDTTYRIFDLCSRIYFLDEPLYLYRKRRGSITQTGSRKNMEDRNLACRHLEAFMETHTPEIFSERHLKIVRQSRLSGMMTFYAKGYVDAAEVRAACEGVDQRDCGFRIRTACRIIRFCPGLLKILYPVYRPFRILVWKVFGR